MSAIIENMEMPKNCYDCRFVCDSFGSCDLTDEKIPDYKFFPVDDELERPNWCPLKELKGE